MTDESTVELELPRESGEVERALEILSAAGALELEFEDSGATGARLWGRFAAPGAQACARVAELVAAAGISVVRLEAAPILRRDWASVWSPVQRPLCIGGIWIGPTRVAGEPSIVIEASNAFGSGMHPTTQLCLERVAELTPRGSFLDIGTGTGILALFALARGFSEVVGIDNARSALAAAENNAFANGYEDRLELKMCRCDELGKQFDLIVANVLASDLIEMAGPLVRTMRSDATLLISGVARGSTAEVETAFVGFGMCLLGRREREGWMLLEFGARW